MATINIFDQANSLGKQKAVQPFMEISGLNNNHINIVTKLGSVLQKIQQVPGAWFMSLRSHFHLQESSSQLSDHILSRVIGSSMSDRLLELESDLVWTFSGEGGRSTSDHATSVRACHIRAGLPRLVLEVAKQALPHESEISP